MINFLVYLLQSSIAFSLLYLIYKGLLSKLTFHSFNRYVLLLLLPISLLLPFADVLTPEIPSVIVPFPTFNELGFDSEYSFQGTSQEIVAAPYNKINILFFVYYIGGTLFLIRLMLSIKKIITLKKRYTADQKNGYQLIIADVPTVFSMFNWIFIPKNQEQNDLELIIAHEKAHIHLRHTIDVIISELYIAIFWFNPLVYLYRKSLKSVHEFQADATVLKNDVKTSNYLQLLLQNIEIQNSNNLYNYFNQPVIKKRITMITTPSSHQLNKLKYFLFLSATVGLSVAFIQPKAITEKVEVIGLELPIDKPAENTPPSLFPVQNGSIEDITAGFGKRKHPISGDQKMHQGIDIRAKIGTPVFATANGIIAKATEENKWGNLIIINHENGYQTWYAHLKGFNTTKDAQVKKGDIIGYVGNSGLSMGPHLHYEVRLNDTRLDPMTFIKE